MLVLRPFSTKTLDTPCYRDFRKAFASKFFKTPDGPLRLSGVFHFRSPLMRLSTSAQFIANQANAQQSTGPKTPEGKAIAARNNFRHGFTGEFTVLPWEQQEEFDRLLNALRDEHKAADLTERILVDKMAQALWLTKRALMLQHVTFNHELPTCDDEKQLALYIRYHTTHERNFHKCLNDLLRLRAEKRKQQIGFESHKRKEADQTRRAAGEDRKKELHRYAVLLAEAKLDHQLLQTSTLRPGNSVHTSEENTKVRTQQAA
jgi:choline dehydrogenase-like flavoprotein